MPRSQGFLFPRAACPSASVSGFDLACYAIAGLHRLGKTEGMLRRDLPGGCCLRLLEESDAEALYALVDANRTYLARWLPWVEEAHGSEFVLTFIRATRRQLADNDGFQTAIVDGEAIIGVVGFHGVDWRNRSTSIGYWLAENRQGRGTMTEAVRALADHAFAGWNLNRVEIRVAPGNVRSRAIPSRLGFVEEGVLCEAERLGERFEDSVVYSMLAKDLVVLARRRPSASVPAWCPSARAAEKTTEPQSSPG